ncbi:MAG: substrate-binding domain-containing protein [Elusimicrobiota bacterium]|jgi:simple sugar transport system substrate-binding protein|nr:substrate-binding domain-containing protein [Elusimicrobiota bacterium]
MKNRDIIIKFKLIIQSAIMFSLLLFQSCNSDSPAAVASKTRSVLKKTMPYQMKDGKIKVLIIANTIWSPYIERFIEGCASEGNALGFNVDTLVTGGNSESCKEAISKAAKDNYDGIILSHSGPVYTYDSLLPITNKGIKAVTFDSYPYTIVLGNIKYNEMVKNVTSTALKDEKLARLSLQSLVNSFPGKKPIKVIRSHMGPGIMPIEARKRVYDTFVKNGYIEEVGAVKAHHSSGNPYREVQEQLLWLLDSDLKDKEIDAVWSPYDELAKGCLEALIAANRRDIKLFSIDICDEDINLMRSNKSQWISTAAADPRQIGVVNMRILAAKFANERTPKEIYFDVYLIESDKLKDGVNMSNITNVIPRLGDSGKLFSNYEWMRKIRVIRGGRQGQKDKK